jgi:hypothetical protein
VGSFGRLLVRGGVVQEGISPFEKKLPKKDFLTLDGRQ